MKPQEASVKPTIIFNNVTRLELTPVKFHEAGTRKFWSRALILEGDDGLPGTFRLELFSDLLDGLLTPEERESK